MTTVRRAGPADVAELVRLRQAMFDSFEVPADDGAWRAACAEELTRRLTGPPTEFAAYLVDVGAGCAAACGVGWVQQHLPSPANLTGRTGYIASMSTDPLHRRHGHARSIVAALLGWFADIDINRVDLHASPAGLTIYEDAGFSAPPGLALRWRAPL